MFDGDDEDPPEADIAPEPPDPTRNIRDPTPEVEIPDPSNASAELQFAFWSLVVVFNVALFALSLGAMFVVFDGNYELGSRLLAVGAVAGVYGLYRYRKVTRKD